jgi:hypothetical protein
VKLVSRARLWVGSHFMLMATHIATRIIGDEPLKEHLQVDDEEDHGVVYSHVELNDRAKEMIAAGRPQPRKRPEKPKPLKGSIADRLQRR